MQITTYYVTEDPAYIWTKRAVTVGALGVGLLSSSVVLLATGIALATLDVFSIPLDLKQASVASLKHYTFRRLPFCLLLASLFSLIVLKTTALTVAPGILWTMGFTLFFGAADYLFDLHSTTTREKEISKQIRLLKAKQCRTSEQILIALEENVTPKELSLNQKVVSSIGPERFAKALAQNSSLQKLSLYFPQVREGDFIYLKAALLTNTSLRSLELSGIGSSALKAIAEVLRVNRSIEHLDITFDHRARTLDFTDFCEAMKINTSIRSLRLPHLYNKAFNAFVNVLRVNHSLQSLKMSCYLENNGILSLAKALRNHPSLEELDLSYGLTLLDQDLTPLLAAINENLTLRNFYPPRSCSRNDD